MTFLSLLWICIRRRDKAVSKSPHSLYDHWTQCSQLFSQGIDMHHNSAFASHVKSILPNLFI